MNTWYRTRGYPHFDVPLSQVDAETLVQSPNLVAARSFYPFLKYVLETEIVRGPKRSKVKRRPIMYAAHADAHIYAYYGHMLADAYEQALKSADLTACVTAFRRLSGRCNIHHADDAFQFIDGSRPCRAFAFDVKGFFDNLNHKLLKEQWRALLGKATLPDDHYAVFKSLTRYSWCDRAAVYGMLGVDGKATYCTKARLCDSDVFRDRIRGRNLIFRNSSPKGIPQGSPCSAVLSNIYMLPFDLAANKMTTAVGGRYWRYCDDILIVVPEEKADGVPDFVEQEIKKLHLELQEEKSDKFTFSNLQPRVVGPKPLQYLGFDYDGVQIKIRPKSMGRFWKRMDKAVYTASRTAQKHNAERQAKGMPARPMFRASLYERFSHLGRRNFIRYGIRSADIMQSDSVRVQVHRQWKRLRKLLLKAK